MRPTKRKPTLRTRTAIDPEKDAQTRRILAAAAIAGLPIFLALTSLIYFGTGRSNPHDPPPTAAGAARVRDAMIAAGCTLSAVEAKPGDHWVQSPDDRPDTWNTFPPTNGTHFVDPVIFGTYDEPLQQARVVHNLEHGGIAVQYGSKVPEETVAQLRDFYGEHETGTLLAPLPELGKMIAVGSWVSPDGGASSVGYLAKCTVFDEEAFAAFFDEFQFKGPERFRPEMLRAGQ